MKQAFTMLCLVLFTAYLSGQCETAVTVQTLPFYDTFCTPPEIETQVPEANDCYDCINNANWYRFQVVEGGGLITLEVAFDLCTPSGTNCGNVNGYYWLFDGCPGELLSVPSLGCWGDSIMLSCWWPWYVFDTLTCFSGPPETSSGEEFNYPPSNHYDIQFELEEGDYYIAVAPSGTCDVVAYGCIELEFSGPILLGYVPEEPQVEEEPLEPEDGVYMGSDLQPYILKDGVRYTIYGAKQSNQ